MTSWVAGAPAFCEVTLGGHWPPGDNHMTGGLKFKLTASAWWPDASREPRSTGPGRAGSWWCTTLCWGSSPCCPAPQGDAELRRPPKPCAWLHLAGHLCLSDVLYDKPVSVGVSEFCEPLQWIN